MSISERQQPASSAMHVEARAAEWLARKKDFGGWSDDDQKSLDAWLGESPAHLLAYARLEEAWRFADRLFALRPPAERKAPAPRPRMPYLRIAAVFAVLSVVGITAAIMRVQTPTEKTFSTTVGGRQILTLSDGSRMELNTNTLVRVLLEGNRRTVWLDKGEVYFQVKHDSSRPFVVFANGRRVTDLGTKFLVRNDTGRLDVALLEGRVRLEAASDEPQAMTVLTPGDEAVAVGNTTSVSRQSLRDVMAKLGWQRGVIVFDHTTLSGAAVEFNRYSTKKIVIADPATGAITIDGTFPTNGIAAFVQAARETFKLHTKETDREIVISR